MRQFPAACQLATRRDSRSDRPIPRSPTIPFCEQRQPILTRRRFIYSGNSKHTTYSGFDTLDGYRRARQAHRNQAHQQARNPRQAIPQPPPPPPNSPAQMGATPTVPARTHAQEPTPKRPLNRAPQAHPSLQIRRPLPHPKPTPRTFANSSPLFRLAGFANPPPASPAT